MRVLHLRASNFVGGPERQILRYAEYEREGPVEVIVGSFVGGAEGQVFLAAAAQRGLKTLVLEDGGPWSMGRRLAEFVRQEQVTLICAHGYKATVVGYLARMHERVALAPFLRGWTGEDAKVRFFESLERLLLPRCDRVVCLSESQAQRLESKVDKQHIRVVVNVGEARESSAETVRAARQILRERYKVPEGATVIASAGRLSPEKGTRYFVEAAKLLAAKHPAAFFLVFGDGTQATALHQQAGPLGERIKFAGFVPDFPQLLPGVDILVNASLAEEMPNVVIEAMANGLPVVATAVGGVPEIAGQPPSFPLVPAGDADGLARAIEPLIQDAGLRQRTGATAQTRLCEAYSPARQREQLRSLYRESAPWIRFTEEAAVSLPKISVVMPVRNEERSIGAAVKTLLDQEYPRDRFEILVADGNSEDRTASIVDEIAQTTEVKVRCLPNPGQLSSAGRNVGAKHATGEVVAFVDGHCHIPGRHLLRDIAELLERTSADALCRPQPLHYPGNNEFQRMVASVRGTFLGHGLDSTIYALNNSRFVDPTSSGAIYRKAVFEKIGFYDEAFDACEDVEFNHRVKAAGLKAYIDPSLTIFYQPRASFSALFRQLSRYGKGRFRLIRKHSSAMSLSQLAPPALVLYVGGALATAAFLPPMLRLVVAAPLALYLLLVLGFAVSLVPRHGLKMLGYGPLLFFTVHGGLGWGFITGLLEAAFGQWPKRPGAR